MAHKKITILFVIAIISAVFISCESSQNNLGYPKKVYFEKEGGVQSFTGDMTFKKMTIKKSDGSIDITSIENTDTIEFTDRWFAAIYIRKNNELILKAERSRTGEKRKFEIHGYSGKEHARIQILQKE